MIKLCKLGDLYQKQTFVNLLRKVSSFVSVPTLVKIFTIRLKEDLELSKTQTAAEMELTSLLTPFLGITTALNRAHVYFNPTSIPQYPNCTTVELRRAIDLLRSNLKEINLHIHAIMKQIFLHKDDGTSKETLIKWIGKILDLNELRTTINATDPMYWQMVSQTCSSEGFLLNLNIVLLEFAKPFLDINTQAAKINLIHKQYCFTSDRVDYAKYPKLCEQSNAVPSLDEKAKTKNFGFVSDTFFLALHSLHITALPATQTYKSYLNLISQTKQQLLGIKDQTNPLYHQVTTNLQKFFVLLDGLEVYIGNPEFLGVTLDLCVLTMYWMIKIIKESSPSEAATIFSSFPIYFTKDVLDFVEFVARFYPKEFAKSKNLQIIAEFCVTVMNRADLYRSPLLRARASIILSVFIELSKLPAVKPVRGVDQSNTITEQDKMLFSLVFVKVEPTVRDNLIAGLVRTYLDIGDVEGLDVDKDQIDKYTVRKDIAGLLNHLWTQSDYNALIISVISGKNPEHQSQKFLSTVLSDSIMLLDDSLHRLTDIKTLQEAMDNKAVWDAQPQSVRENRERYYHGQERSSKAFLALANAILDFLLNTSRSALVSFTRSPDMIQKLVSMLLYFFGRLCGPQMKQLKVKEPQKYGFNPKELLGKIASIATAFSNELLFVSFMSKDIDYDHALLLSTFNILQKHSILPSHSLTQFQSLLEKLNSQNTQPTTVESTVEPMEVVDDSNNETEEECEKRYQDGMRESIFDELNMKRDDGTYNHHYNDIILKNTTVMSKNKMTRLNSECQMFSDSLPLSRASSVFVRIDSERMDVMRAIITGPKGTPYSYGVYVFDIFFPSTYPQDPPLVNLETTGNGTVRFNPNLYTDGKVCLSLLGTWHGDQNSKWNPLKSNLHQVLLSIQGLIMVEQPYYNEPSYELQRGTKEGDEASGAYNESIMYNNVKYAIIQQLRSPPAGLEQVVKTHFTLLKHDIIKYCNSWYQNSRDKQKVGKIIEQLKSELSKL
eukprot:TRINITY_DN1092_c0_g1_i5.p1 TRINITY_DN1092_c0_g1~~TRINITY_DN1092_c0_g1_i5.p1  ORF type:complete len:1002 (+),score=201.44 TRINITY_DN1092_c0_g1_i5:636-3641(+)